MAAPNRSQLYCTYLDVIKMITDISTIRTNLSSLGDVIVRPEQHLEEYIRMGDSIIKGYLVGAYPELTGVDTTPWSTSPVVPINPETGLLKNAGNVNLLKADVASDAGTAVWRLVCTNSGAQAVATFRFESSLEGLQGTAKVYNAQAVSTNGDVTIESTYWIDNSTDQSGFSAITADTWMFSTITTYPLIWTISVNLAVAFALNSIFTGIGSSESPSGAMYYNRAMGLLKDISSGKLAIDIGFNDINLPAPTEVRYDVNELGTDTTDYGTSDYGSYN